MYNQIGLPKDGSDK